MRCGWYVSRETCIYTKETCPIDIVRSILTARDLYIYTEDILETHIYIQCIYIQKRLVTQT